MPSPIVRINFGNPRYTSGQFQKSSEDLETTASEIFGRLQSTSQSLDVLGSTSEIDDFFTFGTLE